MTNALAGKRVLVVEDEYVIAADLRWALTQHCAVVVGLVGTFGAALDLAAEPLDAAVLDVNLEEALAYPVADRLRSRNVPYLFLTGYDGWSLPSAYQDDPRVTKPFAIHTVMDLVERLIAAGREAP